MKVNIHIEVAQFRMIHFEYAICNTLENILAVQ